MSESKDILDTVYRENEPYIRKLCKYKLKSIPSEVDDCVQETFTAFAEALGKGKEIKKPKAWLTKVADNIIKDTYSKNEVNKARLVPLVGNETNENLVYCIDYDSKLDFDEIWIEIYKEYILRQLTDDEQSLIIDRYLVNKSISTMAADRNTTENNIYQKLSRLKVKTKMLIGKVLNEQGAQR